MMPAFLQPDWASELTVEDTPLISHAIMRQVSPRSELPGEVADLIDEALS